jgi:hypothetical protein
MPIDLTVNSITFPYPTAGQSPGWGQAATDWATEVTEVLNELKGPNDIAQTTFNIQNNISTFTNIAGLSFNTGQVRAATIQYSIYRTSTANPSGYSEGGTINIVYDNSAGSGSKWLISAGNIAGNSGVTFTVTDAGQFQYKSTDITAPGYSGVMTFRAKSLTS